MTFFDLFKPEQLLRTGGLGMLLAIVYAETGLMVGFFLPGDSLLFIAGILAGSGFFSLHPVFVVGLVCLAAMAGDQTGYWFGRNVGPRLFKRDDSLIFKKRYIEMARDFYQRRGGFALIMGKFLPIFRTFVPIVAGVVKLDYRRFLAVDVTGVLLWVNLMMWAGFFLGSIEWVKDNLEYIVIGLIVITTIPIVVTWLRERKKTQQAQ
jgi:membrane-associated protein